MTRLRMILALAGLALMLVFILLALSWCSERDRTKRAQSEASIGVATGKALDSVATETPVIRQDQEEKQREVDEIQGAGDRLPDGFGAELERVRRGSGKRDDPR